MVNIHGQARKYLAGEGIKLSDAQKKAVFLFADFVAQQKRQPTKRAGGLASGECPKCHNFGGTHFSLCPLANSASR